jgi:iron complex outermembrane receptor protein
LKRNQAAIGVIGTALLAITGVTDGLRASAADLDGLMEVHIPAENLADALITLGRQSGLQIMTAAGDLQGLRAPAIDGRMSARTALAALLRGTRLQYRQVGASSVAIHPVEGGASAAPGTTAPQAPTPGSLPSSAVAPMRSTPAADGAGPAHRYAFAPAVANERLQEIVVTAEKFPVDVMHAPVSVTAINGEGLQRDEIRQLQDLQFYVPGLSVQVTPNGSTLNIRGIGLTFQSPNIAQGVPVYHDGMLVPTSVADEPLWDVANIQVLRGPQGTLLGANSTGGAVFINTANPALGGDVRGQVQLMGGDYRHSQAQAVVNVPIAETVAARLGVYVEQRDSFSRALTPSTAAVDASLPLQSVRTDPGELNMLAWRASVLWQPSTLAQLLGKVEYFRNDTGYAAEKPLIIDSTAVSGVTTLCPAPGSYFNADPVTWVQVPGTCGNSAFAPADPYRVADAAHDEQAREQIWRESLEAKLQLTEDGPTLRLLAGASYNTVHVASENTASLDDTGGFSSTTHEHTLTYEADLLSPGASALQWVVGGFWWRDPSQFAYRQLSFSGGPLCVGTTPSGAPCSVPTPGSLYLDGANVRTNYALFGNVKYQLDRHWTVEAGVRETWDLGSNPFQPCTPPGAPDGPSCQSGTANAFHFLQVNPQNPWAALALLSGRNSGFPNFGEESDRLFTWKAALEYALTPQSYLYGELATGAKAGGIRTNHLDDNFAPEKDTDFEFGWKATTFGGHGTVQLDGFYMRYIDMQVRARTTADGQESIFNAGSADDYGIEFAAQTSLGRWELSGTASWIQSRFTLGDIVNDDVCGLYRPCNAANNVGQCPPGVPISGPGVNGAGPCFNYRAGGVTLNGQFFPFVESVDGLQLPNSPRFQIDLSVGYRYTLSASDILIPTVDFSYQDKQYIQIYNTPLDLFSSRRNLNLKLSYAHVNWLVEGFITNLTGELYPVAQADQATEILDAPRQYGVRVTRSF